MYVSSTTDWGVPDNNAVLSAIKETGTDNSKGLTELMFGKA